MDRQSRETAKLMSLRLRRLLKRLLCPTASLWRSVAARDTALSRTLHSGGQVSLKYATVQLGGRNLIGTTGKISGNVSLGFATTVGACSHLVGGTISVGNYCQFGPHVGVYAVSHPYTHLTSYVNSRLLGGRLKAHQLLANVSIGNDVWIGHGAVVLPGLSIGDGCVIGAGAIVTKDVEDFSVVVGNPAREIRKRFSRNLVELMKELRWWDMAPDELAEIAGLFDIDFVRDESSAAKRIARYLGRGLQP